MKFLGVAEGSEELFDIVDSDRSGSVSISEFIDGWQVWQDGIMSKGECLVDRRIKFGDYIQQELLRVGTNGAIHRVTSPIDNESYAAKIIGKSCFRSCHLGRHCYTCSLNFVPCAFSAASDIIGF